jgi:mRNA interferase MazF
MAITSQPLRAGFPLTFELPQDCLPLSSCVKISQLRTIPVERIGKRVGEVGAADLTFIVGGLMDLIS